MVQAICLEFLDPKEPDLAGELEAWIEAVHIPELSKLPGVTGVIRGTLSADQQAGMRGPRHRFLNIVQVETDGLSAFTSSMTASALPSAPALDLQSLWRTVYLQSGERHTNPEGAEGDVRILSFVFVGPKDPKHIDDYDTWMESPHVPEMLAVPGCVAGTRYRYSPEQPLNSVGPNHPFLNFWEVETSSGDEYQRQLKAHPRTPTSEPIVDVEHIQHVNYLRI